MQSIQWNIKYYYLNNEMNTNTHTADDDEDDGDDNEAKQ